MSVCISAFVISPYVQYTEVMGVRKEDWIQEDALHGQRIGYVQVSHFDQNPERPLGHV